MTTILLVDDDTNQLKILGGYLKKQGYQLLFAENGNKALEIFETENISIVITDLKMPQMDGAKLIYEINKKNPSVKKIMITAYADVETAVNVMKSGADDFIEKPVNLEKLLKKLKTLEFADSQETQKEISELPVQIIGQSTQIKKAIQRAVKVASKDWTVLLNGETGTGKELFARLIHLMSKRKEKPFVEINCGAIPENLFESEIFGHVKGAFTGADKDKKGLAEAAHTGTLFLDEIGEMPLMMQAKLLRFLQEGKFQKVGDHNTTYCDVRIIAATNQNLEEMVLNKEFREDLYYRISVLDIKIPPLRERKSDIIPIAQYFFTKYQAQDFKFNKEAEKTVLQYNFPGNVRELEHIVQKLITFADSKIINQQDLPMEIVLDKSGSYGLKEEVGKLEKQMIVKALEDNNWNQSKSAENLGISERVLRYKMKNYLIENSKKLP